MIGCMTDTVIKRKSIPLTERDLTDLAKLRGDADRIELLSALARAANPGSDASEAALLHLVIEAGFQTIQDRADEAGYAAWAADTEWWDEHRKINDQMRRRRLAREREQGRHE